MCTKMRSTKEKSEQTARELQQSLALSLGSDGVCWDLYTEIDDGILKDKISYLMPDMQLEPNLESIKKNSEISEEEKKKKCIECEKKIKDYNLRMEKIREGIFKQLWSQRKYSGGNLLSTLIFVMLTPEQEILSTIVAEDSTVFTVHPVFRIRKCILNKNNSNKCCMIFVDELGRSYCNWTDYITHNKLAKGVMVLPKFGIYDFYDDNEVILDCLNSPECSLMNRLHKGLDYVIPTVGLVSSVCLLAPMAVAAAPVAGAALAATTGYSVYRSSDGLLNRHKHEQSINVLNRETVGLWSGLVTGVVGCTSSVATSILAKMALKSSGEISILTQNVVNGINVTSIVISGAGISYGILECYWGYKDDNFSSMDFLHLCASLVLFTHSVYNFQYASTIVERNQTNTIDDFKKGLNRNQRKKFGKLQQKIYSEMGVQKGQYDIIRSIKAIPDNSTYGDFKVALLNRNDATGLTGRNTWNSEHTVYFIKGIITLGKKYAFDETDFTNCLLNIYDDLKEQGVRFLYEIVEKFYEEYHTYFESELSRIIPFESMLWDLFKILKSEERIINNLENLTDYTSYLLTKLKEHFDILIKPPGAKTKCSHCPGFYFLTSLSDL